MELKEIFLYEVALQYHANILIRNFLISYFVSSRTFLNYIVTRISKLYDIVH